MLCTPFAEPERKPPFPPAVIDMPLIDRARPDIIEMLGRTPIEIDELVHQSGLGPGVIALILLELDLARRLERLPGQRVALSG